MKFLVFVFLVLGVIAFTLFIVRSVGDAARNSKKS
jgi:F0F1-type ATP synthase assembly protein I